MNKARLFFINKDDGMLCFFVRFDAYWFHCLIGKRSINNRSGLKRLDLYFAFDWSPAEVFRGRFRDGFAHPKPFRPGEVAKIEYELQDILHTFLNEVGVLP